MQESVKFEFYRIHNCGYYKYNNPKPKYGSIEEILSDIQKWGQPKSIIKTKLYEPVNDRLPVYLFKSIPSKTSKDWLLVMWNEVPSTNSKVASIVGSSTVANPTVVLNSVKSGSIPGFPTYFWFIPEKNMFASIKFRNRTNTGQGAMRAYIEAALERISSFVHKDPNSGEILGYAPPNAQPEKLYPKFRTFRAQKSAEMDKIINNAPRIGKVYFKDTLKLTQTIDKQWWQTGLRKIGLGDSYENKRTQDVKMKYEFIPKLLTKKDVKSMIKEWKNLKQNGWNDYGFSMIGDSNSILWLSKSLIKADADLDVIWQNSEIVEPYSLLEQLNLHRDTILNKI